MDEEFNGRCVYWNTSTDLLLNAYIMWRH